MENEKVEPKKTDNLHGKFTKKVGGKSFAIPKLGIQRLKTKWNSMKQKLTEYTKDEAAGVVASREGKVDEQLKEWRTTRDAARKEARKNPDDKNIQAALDYSRERIEKLKVKRKKISKKGLGVFALSGIAIKKITTQGINNAQEKISNVKQSIAERKDKIVQKIEEKLPERSNNEEIKNLYAMIGKLSEIVRAQGLEIDDLKSRIAVQDLTGSAPGR
jgi:hypothetical protein